MRVAVAGTFGPLHDGHRALFSRALERGDEGVVVGLTSDELAQETRSEPREVPPFEERRARVSNVVSDLDRWDRDVEIRKIHDEHDFAATEPAIRGVVVSPETEPEVAEINELRTARGLQPLEAIVVPFVRADDGERISSTRMVKGAIDEHGRS